MNSHHLEIQNMKKYINDSFDAFDQHHRDVNGNQLYQVPGMDPSQTTIRKL